MEKVLYFCNRMLNEIFYFGLVFQIKYKVENFIKRVFYGQDVLRYGMSGIIISYYFIVLVQFV